MRCATMSCVWEKMVNRDVPAEFELVEAGYAAHGGVPCCSPMGHIQVDSGVLQLSAGHAENRRGVADTERVVLKMVEVRVRPLGHVWARLFSCFEKM